MVRIVANNLSWAQSAEKVTKRHQARMEETIVGPYLSKGEYTDKATFEEKGTGKSGGLAPISVLLLRHHTEICNVEFELE
jgi:hypothetical protein